MSFVELIKGHCFLNAEVSKEVGVARVTTSTRLALFLLIANLKFYINGFANNSSSQQSKLESKILYIIIVIVLENIKY